MKSSLGSPLEWYYGEKIECQCYTVVNNGFYCAIVLAGILLWSSPIICMAKIKAKKSSAEQKPGRHVLLVRTPLVKLMNDATVSSPAALWGQINRNSKFEL